MKDVHDTIQIVLVLRCGIVVFQSACFILKCGEFGRPFASQPFSVTDGFGQR